MYLNISRGRAGGDTEGGGAGNGVEERFAVLVTTKSKHSGHLDLYILDMIPDFKLDPLETPTRICAQLVPLSLSLPH